ncbi:hypothetical protein H9L39_03704 [Fusarium oxysporum f. sp. albedinis]|nr:hypothetical protein H9L39_03704 [Fusarium oxysporum f. sp. albedinis]
MPRHPPSRDMQHAIHKIPHSVCRHIFVARSEHESELIPVLGTLKLLSALSAGQVHDILELSFRQTDNEAQPVRITPNRAPSRTTKMNQHQASSL